jgi:hypothetical protein
MTFQKTVLVVSTTLLVLSLITIAVLLNKAKDNLQWPPMISECPDYWKVTDIDRCQNTMNLGTCGNNADFSSSEWQGKSGLKKKYDWAKGCGLTWDGITNNPDLIPN